MIQFTILIFLVLEVLTIVLAVCVSMVAVGARIIWHIVHAVLLALSL